MNKLFKTNGIIIRKINLNDADRIVTILTDDYGKIDCLAKGARRFKSKFCGRLELFNQVNITCFQGKDLAILNEADLMQGCLETKEINKHKTLFYVAEITHKLIQNNQCIEGVYQLLEETINNINLYQNNDIILHSYLIKLLTLTGFLSTWNNCSKCNNKLNANKPVYVNMMDTSVACAKCKEANDKIININMLKWVNFMQNYPLTDSLKVSISKKEHQTVWGWLQNMLNNLFNTPIKSTEFLVG